jgi:hypothetical protein
MNEHQTLASAIKQVVQENAAGRATVVIAGQSDIGVPSIVVRPKAHGAATFGLIIDGDLLYVCVEDVVVEVSTAADVVQIFRGVVSGRVCAPRIPAAQVIWVETDRWEQFGGPLPLPRCNRP